jgi:hypothetical protein
MSFLKDKINDLIEHLKGYLDTQLELIKIKAVDKSSAIISNAVAFLVVMVFLFFFILLASVAGALVLSVWFGKWYLGFLIVSGLYLLLGIITWKSKENLLRRRIRNAIINALFSQP